MTPVSPLRPPSGRRRAPLETANGTYVLNVSVSSGERVADVVRELAGPLIALRDEIAQAIADPRQPRG